MLRQFDHVVLAVHDLAAAEAAFAAAGFDVFTREPHAKGPMVNRLVRFRDGSFIEILAFTGDSAHRFKGALDKGEGWIDYAIAVDGIEGVQQRLRAAGLSVSDVQAVRGTNSAGQGWELALVLAGLGVSSPAFPFLTQERTPLEWRIPPLPEDVVQPHGVTGIARVRIAVGSLSHWLVELMALYGAPLTRETDASGRLCSATFKAGSGWVEIFTPAPQDPAYARLEEVGDRLFSVTLQGDVETSVMLDIGDYRLEVTPV